MACDQQEYYSVSCISPTPVPSVLSATDENRGVTNLVSSNLIWKLNYEILPKPIAADERNVISARAVLYQSAQDGQTCKRLKSD